MKSLAPHTTAVLVANIIILNTGVMVDKCLRDLDLNRVNVHAPLLVFD
jgi:hypothetical protein